MNIEMKDNLSIKDAIVNPTLSHGLHGHVTIHRRNKKTGETKFWYESDNVISISGMQAILMKIFNLYLDSYHSGGQTDQSHTDNRGRDTNLVIPDLNEKMGIGVKPTNYTTMKSDISEDFFIQGFMVGCGGAGEDSITTKNTDYSFINLRTPIPFQQVSSSLDSSIATKYCGVYQPQNTSVKSYYIKKFDALPHIYHSWWVDGQRWDYVDPVMPTDLGPNAENSSKTNRIETYAECKLSIDESDCKAWFEAEGNSRTAQINELGLVAFDSTNGARSSLSKLYQKVVTELLDVVYNNHRLLTADEIVKGHAQTIVDTFVEAFGVDENENLLCTQENLLNFYNTTSSILTSESIDYSQLQDEYDDETNIGVIAYYNQNGVYQYENDQFIKYLNDPTDESLASLSTDEAQRIKLITYYTFNSIPLEENWEILIDYRLYAN
jgi:hypothetical protein